MDEIFREVDEEVRRDRALELWKRYQNWLVLAIVLVFAAVFGWRIFQNQRAHEQDGAALRYLTAVNLLNSGKSDEAYKVFEELANLKTGYRNLAMLQGIAILSQSSADKAISAYDGLLNNPDFDTGFRDIVRLKAAALLVDKAPLKEIESRLGSMDDPSNPYRNGARELLALSALKSKETEKAEKWLDAIVIDKEASQSMRRIADDLSAQLSSEPLSPGSELAKP